MNNVTTKIQDLWRYLRILDDDILIVQVYNPPKLSDHYLVAQKQDSSIIISYTDDFLPLIKGRNFRFIQHLNAHCHHIIPSVRQMERDRLADY